MYYDNYQGPLLTSAVLIDPVNNNEDDYTTLFTFLYGSHQNWRCQLYQMSTVFHITDIGKILCLKFTKGHTNILINNLETIINQPLFMPINQLDNKVFKQEA